jgi:hypothetical protein
MNVRYYRNLGIFMNKHITLSTSNRRIGILYALRLARPGTTAIYYWLGPRYARREYDKGLRSKPK